jgi:predicted glycosyltransferase
LQVLTADDLAPERLAVHLTATFQRQPRPVSIDLAGASKTAAWLERLAERGRRP